MLAANDGLGNAAISALKQRKLPQIPVTGQDATLQGIQNIVNGDQCMTVYKAIKKEADAAAKLAIALAKGETPDGATDTVNNGTKDVPSVLLDPVAVTKDNIKEYIGEPDFPKKEEICAGKLAAKCKEIGLSRDCTGASAGARPGLRSGGGGARIVTDTPVLELRRGLEELRRGPGPLRGRLPRVPRRGHGPRRRQRRRQVDADQVHRRDPPGRQRRDPASTASR